MKFGKEMYDEMTSFPPEMMESLVFYRMMKKLLKHELRIHGGKIIERGERRTSDISVESTASDGNQDACSICLEPVNGESTIVLECTHKFHQLCFRGWVGTGQSRCPTCRTEIKDLFDFRSALQKSISVGNDLSSSPFWKFFMKHRVASAKLFEKHLFQLQDDTMDQLAETVAYLKKYENSMGLFAMLKRAVILKKSKNIVKRILLLRNFYEYDSIAIVKILKKHDKLLGYFTKDVILSQILTTEMANACAANGKLSLVEVVIRGLYNIVYESRKVKNPNVEDSRKPSYTIVKSWMGLLEHSRRHLDASANLQEQINQVKQDHESIGTYLPANKFLLLDIKKRNRKRHGQKMLRNYYLKRNKRAVVGETAQMPFPSLLI